MPNSFKPRVTVAGLLVLVALAAVLFAYLKPAMTRVVDVKVGTGPPVKSGDVVTVHYVGTLADGTKFDSSRDRNAPVDFTIGKGMLIRGWDAGMQGMQAGGVRKLTIPPEDGYGAKPVGPIPANSTLYFEIELLSIAPTSAPAPAATSGPASP